MSEPLYCRMGEEETAASTSVKSMPPAIEVLVPGVEMEGREEERERISELDSPAETWNIRDKTASWVSSAVLRTGAC